MSNCKRCDKKLFERYDVNRIIGMDGFFCNRCLHILTKPVVGYVKEVPKTGDIVYQITIDRGVVTKGNPLIVRDRENFALCSYEFSDGNSRYSTKNLYPCEDICGGPLHAPLGLGYDAFIYAFEKDVEEATKFLIDKYAIDCITIAKEVEEIGRELREFSRIAKGE